MNRFFYSCKECLFRVAIDHDDFRAPRSLNECPVCGQVPQLLGATRGVLRWDVPCNANCVYAIGRDCTCSCGGKNHGSKIVVPMIGQVADYSNYPQAPLAEIRRDYQRWTALKSRIVQTVRPELSESLRAYAASERLSTESWCRVIAYNRAWRYALAGGTYRIRFSRLEAFRAAHCVGPVTGSDVERASSVVPFSSSQLVFAI